MEKMIVELEATLTKRLEEKFAKECHLNTLKIVGFCLICVLILISFIIAS